MPSTSAKPAAGRTTAAVGDAGRGELVDGHHRGRAGQAPGGQVAIGEVRERIGPEQDQHVDGPVGGGRQDAGAVQAPLRGQARPMRGVPRPGGLQADPTGQQAGGQTHVQRAAHVAPAQTHQEAGVGLAGQQRRRPRPPPIDRTRPPTGARAPPGSGRPPPARRRRPGRGRRPRRRRCRAAARRAALGPPRPLHRDGDAATPWRSGVNPPLWGATSITLTPWDTTASRRRR